MHHLSYSVPAISQRDEIISNFFPDESLGTSKDIPNYASYLSYFEKQCRAAKQHARPQYHIFTRETILVVVEHLRNSTPRETIRADLSSRVVKQDDKVSIDELVDDAIDLVVRLWLMVRIGTLPRGVTSQTEIKWRGGCIREAMAQNFRHETILTDSVKFDKKFNARNVERIADVKIQWTPNLVDHLRFLEDGKRPLLNIFYCAGFLNLQKNNTIYPPGLINETLQTLALLLPTHDKKTRKWFETQHNGNNLDANLINVGQLKLHERQIAHFKYWHDRLIIIKQYFDDSKPRTIKQWWYDDRKRVQWFWVAIVLVVCTIVFGIIQCVEGGWQVWKAYHPSKEH